MDSVSVLAILTMFSWGIGSFLAKLATNRIGEKSIVWDLIGYIPATLIYTFILFRGKDLFVTDRIGALLGVLAGAIGAFGGVWFYFLMTKKEASAVVPLTALYPALTAVLAFVFLRESITVVRILGIVFAMAAIYLLSL